MPVGLSKNFPHWHLAAKWETRAPLLQPAQKGIKEALRTGTKKKMGEKYELVKCFARQERSHLLRRQKFFKESRLFEWGGKGGFGWRVSIEGGISRRKKANEAWTHAQRSQGECLLLSISQERQSILRKPPRQPLLHWNKTDKRHPLKYLRNPNSRRGEGRFPVQWWKPRNTSIDSCPCSSGQRQIVEKEDGTRNHEGCLQQALSGGKKSSMVS